LIGASPRFFLGASPRPFAQVALAHRLFAQVALAHRLGKLLMKEVDEPLASASDRRPRLEAEGQAAIQPRPEGHGESLFTRPSQEFQQFTLEQAVPTGCHQR
jgi:hypothetical protein